MNTRSDQQTSLQVALWGSVTGLSSDNFECIVNDRGVSAPRAFALCNNTDDTVFVEIQPWLGSDFVVTRLDPGWNPLICKRIKRTSQILDLTWGY